MEQSVLRHTCSSGGESCSEASVHTSLITRTLKCERTHYNVLYCYALCTVLLYSHVLNKVSCYTVLEESCCDTLHALILQIQIAAQKFDISLINHTSNVLQIFSLL